jgi:hypothetical protein
MALDDLTAPTGVFDRELVNEQKGNAPSEDVIAGPLSRDDPYDIASGSDDDLSDHPTVTVALVVKIIIFAVLADVMVWMARGHHPVLYGCQFRAGCNDKDK